MPKPVEFSLQADETAVIQFADGREVELTCVKSTQTQALLAVNPSDEIKRVMKLITNTEAKS